jgi:hypothetical protein
MGARRARAYLIEHLISACSSWKDVDGSMRGVFFFFFFTGRGRVLVPLDLSPRTMRSMARGRCVGEGVEGNERWAQEPETEVICTGAALRGYVGRPAPWRCVHSSTVTHTPRSISPLPAPFLVHAGTGRGTVGDRFGPAAACMAHVTDASSRSPLGCFPAGLKSGMHSPFGESQLSSRFPADRPVAFASAPPLDLAVAGGARILPAGAGAWFSGRPCVWARTALPPFCSTVACSVHGAHFCSLLSAVAAS